MIKVAFTPNLQRHLDCPSYEVEADSVGAALRAVFDNQPRLRGYILDDQGRLRRHVMVFVDGRRLKDETGLSDPVGPDGEIYVMQALSGGADNRM